MPSTTLAAEDFQDGAIDLISLLCKAGLVTSRSEGRRAIEQGGVSVDGEKITDIRYNVKKERYYRRRSYCKNVVRKNS